MYQHKTSDISLAAYLLLKNHNFVSLEEATSAQARWVFEGNEKDMVEDIDAFYKRKCVVEPRAYFYAVRSIKSALYNQREEEGGTRR